MALTTVTGSLVSVNAIQGTLIADNAITAVHIATNAVSGTLIADNAVTAVHIAQNSITVTQLADDCVESDKIADGIITTNHLNKAMISSQTEVSAATGDFVLLGDTSDSNNLKKTPVSSIIGLASGTTINTNADNRIITGSGTANTLNGESNLTFDGNNNLKVLAAGNTTTGGNIQLGITTDDAAKYTAITAQQHNSGTETEGFTLIGGNSAAADTNLVNIGGGFGEQNPATQIQFYTGSAATREGTLRMVIDPSGDVGIGATTIDEKLHIEVSSGDAAIKLEDASGDFIRIDQNSLGANDKIRFKSGSSLIERMRITSTGNVGINETSPDFSGFGSNGGGLELDDVGSSFTAVKVSQGSTGNLYLAASTGAGYLWQHSNSPLIIGTNNAERIRIQDGTGRMGINSVGIAYSSSEKLSLYNDNFGFGIKAAYTGMGIWNTESSGGYIAFAYGSGGAAGGSISYSGGTTSYNTSSDYRLKENVNYTWDATTRLKQLKPARFNWISDNTDTLIDGFLAHEVSSIVPEAVTGEKDAVYTAEEAENSAGAEAGDIKVQVMDNSKLVPLLVKTIQELEARVKILEG